MTIASEITRLQGAKSSARTSIINKGVSVPASAKLDTYHNYIDQISTGGAFMDSLSLKGHMVTGIDATPVIGGYMAWNDNSAYYGAIVLDISSSSEDYYIVCVKKQAGSDIQYKKASTSPGTSSMHGRIEKVWYYKNGNNIRIFFSEVSTHSSGYAWWFQADWDGTNTPTIVQIARNNSWTTLPPEADTTGYTEVNLNTWFKSVVGQNTEEDAYIYITTK